MVRKIGLIHPVYWQQILSDVVKNTNHDFY